MKIYRQEEKLYSTGNDELDMLLERAFSDGYEYAQREFARVKIDTLTRANQLYQGYRNNPAVSKLFKQGIETKNLDYLKKLNDHYGSAGTRFNVGM